MQLYSRRLVLERMSAPMARGILDGVPLEGDTWAPGYPLADELDVVPGYLAGAGVLDLATPFGLFVIRTGSDLSACGGLGFFGPPDEDGAVEIGYGLVPAARGRGLATEAVLLALGAAADHGARVVRADTDAANTASQRVLLKSGLVEVGRDDATVRYQGRLT